MRTFDRTAQPERLLRICYFGTYRANYTRSQLLLKGLRSRPDVEVIECHAQLWRGIEDRVAQASGGWTHPRFWLRVVKAYWQLLRQHHRTPEYDVMLIGYPGQFDAYLGRLLTWWRRRPMALDILMSLHLVAEERGLVARSPFTGRLIYALEKGGLRQPDMLISENSAYERYYIGTYGLDARKFRRVPHGADETMYHPRPLQPPKDCFRVTYHGGFLPSHGMDAIIGAALLLRDQPNIHFHFYGTGPEEPRIRAIAARERLGNVTFHGFVPFDALLNGLAQAHVVCGVFGETRQSHYTVQNKIWEGLALGRPVVSGDSAVVREALTDREHIYLIPRRDPRAFALAILDLLAHPEQRERMAWQGYARYLRGNATAAIGKILEAALRECVERGDVRT